MKIFYSAQEKYPTFRVDLSELFFVELAKLGLDITWFMNRDIVKTCSEGFTVPDNVHLPPCVNHPGAISRAINKICYIIFDVVAILRLLLSDEVELIQVRDKYVAALVGLCVARIKGIPFTYWCSYPYPEHESFMSRQAGGVKKLVFLLRSIFGRFVLYKCVMRYADFNFVQSGQMLKDIAAYGVQQDKMMPVPMGVSADMLSKVQRLDSKEVKPKTIIYLGTLASVRRMETIIEAFSLVSKQHLDARLLMVGDGDYPYERESLEALTRKLGIQDSVTFTGFIPASEAWRLVSESEICLSPFYPTKVLASTSPTKLVEYMALGKPVIVNDHPEQSAVIKDSGAGLCVEWGSESFAAAINWMLEHSDEAIEMGKKGPDWVRRNRTYPIIAAQVYKQYVKMLGDER